MSSVELPGPARAAHAPMSPHNHMSAPLYANLDLRKSVPAVMVKKTSPRFLIVSTFAVKQLQVSKINWNYQKGS